VLITPPMRSRWKAWLALAWLPLMLVQLCLIMLVLVHIGRLSVRLNHRSPAISRAGKMAQVDERRTAKKKFAKKVTRKKG
jgi:hypothetical protein